MHFRLPAREHTSVVKAVREGKVKQPEKDSPNCGEAPCKDNVEVYKICTEGRECPYVLAIEVAQQNSVVVHNSFIFQSNFGGNL